MRLARIGIAAAMVVAATLAACGSHKEKPACHMADGTTTSLAEIVATKQWCPTVTVYSNSLQLNTNGDWSVTWVSTADNPSAQSFPVTQDGGRITVTLPPLAKQRSDYVQDGDAFGLYPAPVQTWPMFAPTSPPPYANGYNHLAVPVSVVPATGYKLQQYLYPYTLSGMKDGQTGYVLTKQFVYFTKTKHVLMGWFPNVYAPKPTSDFRVAVTKESGGFRYCPPSDITPENDYSQPGSLNGQELPEKDYQIATKHCG